MIMWNFLEIHSTAQVLHASIAAFLHSPFAMSIKYFYLFAQKSEVLTIITHLQHVMIYVTHQTLILQHELALHILILLFLHLPQVLQIFFLKRALAFLSCLKYFPKIWEQNQQLNNKYILRKCNNINCWVQNTVK